MPSEAEKIYAEWIAQQQTQNPPPVQAGASLPAIPTQPVQANVNPPVQGQPTPEQLLQEYGQFQQQNQPQRQPDPGFWAKAADFATGGLRGREELSDLPEVATARGLTSGSFANDLQTAAGLMFASNDEAKKDIIKSNFPGTTFKKDKKGNEIATFPDGRQAVLNKPGFSFQDALGFVGDVAAFFGPAKLAGLGKGLMTRFGIGALAEGATEAGLQKGVQFLGSEQPVDPVDVAAAGLTAGAGEIGGAALDAIRRRGATKTLGTQISGGGRIPPTTPPTTPAGAAQPEGEFVQGVLSDIARGEEASKATGIPLFRAQKTADPTDLDRQSYVSLLSGGSRVAAEALKKQNKASYDAVIDFMATVAPEKQIAGAAVRTRNAAQMAIEAQKELRKETAGKFYKEAFQDAGRYKPSSTFEVIARKADEAGTGSGLENSMKRIQRLLTPKGTEAQIAQGLTLQQMHEVKRSIDDMISKNIRKGENKLASDLMDVKQSLVAELAGFSPAYDQGRKQFMAQSPAVQALEDSLIGQVSRLKDDQLKRVTSVLFDPGDVGTSIPAMREAKKTIQAADPGAWNDIVRLELEKRVNAAIGPIEQAGETTANIPGILQRSLFGSQKKKEILYSALDSEQRKNLRFLEEALSRASKGRPGGSPTATRQRFEKEIGGIPGRISNWFNPLKAATEAGQEFNFDKNAFALAKIMFDPQWQPNMKKLRKFKIDSPEGAAYFSDLMTRAGKDFRKPAIQAARPENE